MADDPKTRRTLYRYFELSQVGFEMVAPIVLGVLLDRWLEWSPWLTIVGVVLGLVGGITHLVAFRSGSTAEPTDSEGDRP